MVSEEQERHYQFVQSRLSVRIQRQRTTMRQMELEIARLIQLVEKKDALIALLRDRVHEANASTLPVDVP